MSHATANFDVLNVPLMPLEEPGRLAEMGRAAMHFITETRIGRGIVAAGMAGALALDLAGCGGGGALGSGDYDGIVLSQSNGVANLANCVRNGDKTWRYDASSLRSAGADKVEKDSANQASCRQTLTGQGTATCEKPTNTFVRNLKRGDIVEETSKNILVNGRNTKSCTWKSS